MPNPRLSRDRHLGGDNHSHVLLARQGSLINSIGHNNYQERLLHRIRKLIRQMVRIQPVYPEGFKGIKQHLPTAYAGKSDIELFDSWLCELLRYFQLSQMARPKWDELCITTTGQVLKDAAARWYTNNVESPYLEQDWTFEDLICELFKHFVHGSSAQKALDVYNKI